MESAVAFVSPSLAVVRSSHVVRCGSVNIRATSRDVLVLSTSSLVGKTVESAKAFFGMTSRKFTASKRSFQSAASCAAVTLSAEAEDEQEEFTFELKERDIGFTVDDFKNMLDAYGYSFKVGDIVQGTVYQIEPRGALIDIGAKSSAYISNQELSLAPVSNIRNVLKEGEVREFYVLKEENEDGMFTLSLKKLEYQRAWAKLKEAQAQDTVLEGEVLQVNRGGAIARVEGGLRAFVPVSHISLNIPLDDMVGQVLPLRCLEVDEEKNRLIMSHRKAVAENQDRKFTVGDIFVGAVKSIKPYGAFVDIGGVSGLLHISQISHDHIDNVAAILQPEEQVKVMILHQDSERGRISLSTKHLEVEPGDMLKNRQRVFSSAEEMAAKYRLAQEAKAEAKLMQDAADRQSLDELMAGDGAIPTAVDEFSESA